MRHPPPHASPIPHSFLAALALAMLGGCADIPLVAPEPPPGAAPLLTLGSLTRSPSQVAVGEITRSVARALRNKGLRNQVRNDLRYSRHTVEHKLELRSYL